MDTPILKKGHRFSVLVTLILLIFASSKNTYVPSIFITFKKTKSKIMNETRRPATNVPTALACFSLLGKYNKMSAKATIKH